LEREKEGNTFAKNENMKTENPEKEHDLIYQNQLLKIIELSGTFQKNLLKESAVLANRGKDKNWKSEEAIKIFFLKKANETEDEILKKLCRLITETNRKVQEIEKELKLKNSVDFDFFIDVVLEEDKLHQ
jgi:tyrosyl-tRNA synthetase